MQNPKSKTIGIDARMYGYAQTGIGSYILHLLEFLSENDQINNYVIFLMPEEYDTFAIKNERMRKVKVNCKWYGWKEQLLFPFLLYKENLSLMHFTHFNSPIIYFRKSVITIHDITPCFFPGHKMKSPLRRAAFRLVFFASVKKAQRIIAVSESTKNDIVRYFKISPKKIEVIYEGVDKQFRIIEDKKIIEGLKEKYKLKKPFLFYTGVWRNHKNLVGLIKAFKLVREKYKLDITLVLGGKEDPFYPEVRQTWEELGLGREIIPVGFIDQEELPIFYNAACAFVIPSFYEGFGLIGLEAFACGVPVISSDRTSLPEILGRGAIYFNPDDPEDMAKQISMVITQKKLYNELKDKGLLQIKKYSWDEMGKRIFDLYKKI
jgi:glycosyltransferase involved in cell wall biosynthesis